MHFDLLYLSVKDGYKCNLIYYLRANVCIQFSLGEQWSRNESVQGRDGKPTLKEPLQEEKKVDFALQR